MWQTGRPVASLLLWSLGKLERRCVSARETQSPKLPASNHPVISHSDRRPTAATTVMSSDSSAPKTTIAKSNKAPTVTEPKVTVPTVVVSQCSISSFPTEFKHTPTVTAPVLAEPTVGLLSRTALTNATAKLAPLPTDNSPGPTEVTAIPNRATESLPVSVNALPHCPTFTDSTTITVTALPEPPVRAMPVFASQNALLTTDNRPYVPVKIYNTEFLALVDTGAVRSYVGAVIRQLCVENGCATSHPSVTNAKVANGSVIGITEAYQIELTFDNNRAITEVFHYLPGLTVFMVIGMDVLQTHPFRVDLQTKTVTLQGPRVTGQPSVEVRCQVNMIDQPEGLQLTVS